MTRKTLRLNTKISAMPDNSIGIGPALTLAAALALAGNPVANIGQKNSQIKSTGRCEAQ
jgi:hypothetical protein